MKKLFLALILLCAPSARATDFYYAQTAQGSANGTSCANAYAYNDATNGWNAAAKQGPDITAHVCLTVTLPANTNGITVTTQGTSGHPYTIKFETGASIQSPYFPYSTETSGSPAAAIVINTKNYVVIDGGTNGVIKTTANGTLLANKQNSTAISIKSCTGCLVQNLEVGPIYVHVPGNSDTSGFNTDGIVIYQSPSVTVTNVNAHTASFPIYSYYSTVGTFNHEIKNSIIADYNEGIRCPNSATSGVGLSIHNNQFQATGNFDVNSTFHNNAIHCFVGAGGQNLSHPLIYNNIFTGNMGTTNTAIIYMEGTGGGNVADLWVFNNVLVVSNPNDRWSYGLIEVNGTNLVVVNNTIFGPSKQGGTINACIGIGSGSTNVILRNNTCAPYSATGGFNNPIAYFSGTPTWSSVSNNNYSSYNQFGTIVNVGAFNFAAWQTATSGDAAPPTTPNTVPNILTVSPYTPTGAPLATAGADLTAMCSQVINGITAPALCSDLFGNARSAPWSVGAVNPSGVSVPGIPGSLSASVSFSTINLTWSAASGTVAGYTVKRSTTSGGPYTTIATNITTTSYADTNLAAQTYYYVVSAFNSAGSGANSTQASATVQPQVVPPGAPATLTATASGANVNLSWSAALGTPTAYIVKRATVSGGPYTTIATLGLVTTYQDQGLANGAYYYVVTASNSAGSGPNSPQASAVVSTAAALTLLPSASQSFGQVIIGQTGTVCSSGPCTVWVNSTGTSNLVLAGSSAVTLAGPNAADFTIASTTCTNGLSITPGSSCTVTLTFTPSLTGVETASLVIISNDPSSPDVVALSGVGVVPLIVSPSSINFGNVFTNKTSSTQTVTVQNNSGATVTFSSIALTTGTQFHIVSNTCGGSVANNASCTIGLTFAPTSVNTFTDTLTFTDSASTSPQTVSLSGRGKKHGVLRVGAAVNWPGGGELIYTVLREAWGGRETLLDTL